jgi:hypothetical protein
VANLWYRFLFVEIYRGAGIIGDYYDTYQVLGKMECYAEIGSLTPLGQPYAFRQAGLAMGVVLLIVLTITVRLGGVAPESPCLLISKIILIAGRLTGPYV